jgi:phytanoyl-CoA hydroxylase
MSIMRVTMMDKPAQGGTPLPWHQDLSTDWPVTEQPALSIWFPLDQANAASGSLQVVRGSHKHGVIGNGHMLHPSMEPEYAPADKIVTVDMQPGDCLFFHPGLLHRSGINRTNAPRRAINAILMPGYSIHTGRLKPYPVLIGLAQLDPNEVATLTKIPN